MTEELPKEVPTKEQHQSKEQSLPPSYPNGQWRQELNTEYLTEAIEAGEQAGDTGTTEELRKILAIKPGTPSSLLNMNNAPIQPSPRRETNLPSASTYPVGQNRQVLPDLPLSSNPKPSSGK